jgi:hypothetical protein
MHRRICWKKKAEVWWRAKLKWLTLQFPEFEALATKRSCTKICHLCKPLHDHRPFPCLRVIRTEPSLAAMRPRRRKTTRPRARSTIDSDEPGRHRRERCPVPDFIGRRRLATPQARRLFPASFTTAAWPTTTTTITSWRRRRVRPQFRRFAPTKLSERRVRRRVCRVDIRHEL